MIESNRIACAIGTALTWGLAGASPALAQMEMDAPEVAVDIELPEDGVALEDARDPDGYFASLPGWSTARLEREYGAGMPIGSGPDLGLAGTAGDPTAAAEAAEAAWAVDFASWEAARSTWEGEVKSWGAKYALAIPSTYRDVMVSGGGLDGFLYLRRDIFQNLPGTEVEKVAGLMAANAYGPHAAGAVSTKAGYSYLFLPLCNGAPHWAGRAFVNVGYAGDVEVTLKCPA